MLEAFAERWALITGASSGIGAEFASRLAARGMHLILVARREDRLRAIADDLHTRHGTRSEIIVSDLAAPGQVKAVHDQIAQKGITVELLVNNAGFAVVGDVASTPSERVMEMVRLNIGTLTEFTQLYLSDMMHRKHGAIINVASVAAFQPVAYMSAYAASKAYVLHYSEGLWAEARDHGVTVLALCPGVTRTEFFDVAGVAGWLKKQRAQTPDQVVKTALKALEKKKQYVVSGWKNYVLSQMVRLASRRIVVQESKKYFRPTGKKGAKVMADPPEVKSTPPASSPEQPAGTSATAKTRGK